MRFDAKDQKWIGVIFKLCLLAGYEGKDNNDQVMGAVGSLHYCTVNITGELIKVMMNMRLFATVLAFQAIDSKGNKHLIGVE